MPLQLLPFPQLVEVREPDGSHRLALLLGGRDERRFVQVSVAVGDNRLRWVAAAAVCAPGSGVRQTQQLAAASEAVTLSQPRHQR